MIGTGYPEELLINGRNELCVYLSEDKRVSDRVTSKSKENSIKSGIVFAEKQYNTCSWILVNKVESGRV